MFDGFTQKGYSLYISGLPFLVKEKNGEGCVVEVYEVDTNTLLDLDYLEGHPDFYQRQKIFVTNQDTGEEHETYIYILNSSHAGYRNGNPVRVF